MIDLHTHLLPGLDDGAPAMADSVELARRCVAAGVMAVAATPHVSSRHPNRPPAIAAAVRATRNALRTADVPLAVHPGAEVALDQALALGDDELAELRLGIGHHVLLEAPLSDRGDPGPLVEAIQRRGHRVLLAHPERSPAFQRDPTQLERLVAGGVLTSVTASALAGGFGEPARRLAVELVETGLAHDLASDLHDLAGRPPGIAPALEPVLGAVAGLEASLDWLTVQMPRAILAGAPLPAGPALPRRRGDPGGGSRFGLGKLAARYRARARSSSSP